MAEPRAAPRVTITSRGARRLASGHPWIIRADVVAPPAGDADTVIVVDERGRALGSALWAQPPAHVALRVFARGERFAPLDAELVAVRLDAAFARRRALYGALPPACRLVHGEADALPGLFIDRWGDAAVIQTATLGMDRREAAIAAALAARLELRLIVARDDGSLRDHEGLPRRKGILHGGGPTLVEIRSGEVRAAHDLLADAKTGGFLDQRENHERVGAFARGECLDLFSHHGGFALAMAARATRVIAVEQDPSAAARAADNARRSGFSHVTVETADAFAVLRRYESEGRGFDVVVIDPPALAKRGSGAPGPGGGPRPPDHALRAYKELNLRGLRITRPGGFLVTCSCSAKVTPAIFGEILAAAQADSGRQAVIVERRGAASDHPVLIGVPETEYLKCWILQVL